MVRAELSDEQWKEFRKRVLDLEVPMQKHVGSLIIADLETTNGSAASPVRKRSRAANTNGG